MEEELLNSYNIKLKDCIENEMSDDYFETLIKGSTWCGSNVDLKDFWIIIIKGKSYTMYDFHKKNNCLLIAVFKTSKWGKLKSWNITHIIRNFKLRSYSRLNLLSPLLNHLVRLGLNLTLSGWLLNLLNWMSLRLYKYWRLLNLLWLTKNSWLSKRYIL